MIEVNFLIAFGVGVLSFFSPCILPVLPGYFSYLAGASKEKDGSQKRLKVFFVSLAFVLGFSFVLIILGATASALSQLLLINKKFWQKIGGLIIIIFGLQTMGFLKWNFLRKGRSFNFNKFIPWKKGKAFFAGSSFGLAWTPCIGPILGSILILAGQTRSLTQGVGLLAAYALGLSIPMLLSGFFLTQLKVLQSRYATTISGTILLILGSLLFFNQYYKLTIWTAQLFRILKIPIF